MAIPSYTDIVDLLKKGATVEAQEKIMELREAVHAVQEENLNLKKRIRELEGELETKELLLFDESVYWLQVPGSDKHDGPFCQRCYDVNKNLVRLQNVDGRYWNCHECKSAPDMKWRR